MITTTLRSLERTISLAFAGTFFSGDMTFGRVMAASMLILHTRYSLIGCAGALLTEWVSHSLTKNKSLLSSGIIPLNGLFMGLAVAAFFLGCPDRGRLCSGLVCGYVTRDHYFSESAQDVGPAGPCTPVLSRVLVSAIHREPVSGP
jgi:hypothetical protein